MDVTGGFLTILFIVEEITRGPLRAVWPENVSGDGK